MTMKPIHKIPLDGNTVSELVDTENDVFAKYRFAEEMRNSLNHADDEDGNTIMMDWAMQIRSELGISWGECIHAASILFYG